jgi:hypothetical protein
MVMYLEKFTHLIAEYAELTGITQHALILDGAPIEVDGVFFSVLWDEKNKPGYFSLYCDLGELPDDARKSSVIRRLLEFNAGAYMLHGICIMRSPDNQHAVCGANFSLERTSARSFADSLEALAQFAREYRTEFFLDVAVNTLPGNFMNTLESGHDRDGIGFIR